jgi:hypothetical protein
MKNRFGDRGIRGTEIIRKIEGAGSTIAEWCDSCTVVVSVKADIRGWNGEEAQRMILLVWPIQQLRVCSGGLNTLCPCNIVCLRRPNCVVYAIECDRACKRASLCEILVVADNRHDLHVGIRNREDHSISTMIESVVAAIGGGSIVLRGDAYSSHEENEKSRVLHRKDCFGRLEKRGKGTMSGENLEPGNNVRKIPRSTYMPVFVASRQG